MSVAVRRWVLFGLIVTLVPSVSSAAELDELDWIVGKWKRESRRGEVHESWQRLSDRTVEGDSWIVSSSDGTKHALESLLLVEMAGEPVASSLGPVQQPACRSDRTRRQRDVRGRNLQRIRSLAVEGHGMTLTSSRPR